MRRETILVKIPIIIIFQPPMRWLMLFIETSNTFSVSQPPRWLILFDAGSIAKIVFSATYTVVNSLLFFLVIGYYFSATYTVVNITFYQSIKYLFFSATYTVVNLLFKSNNHFGGFLSHLYGG